MDDIIPQHFHYTLSFLHGLVDKSLPYAATLDSSLLHSLSQHLKLDGYRIQSFPEENLHHLRRLEADGAADTGSALIVDVVLIVICVLCAGFASGLTQVSHFCFILYSWHSFLSFHRVFFL
jgi:hypothetical protein